jgi:hypothetical protein
MHPVDNFVDIENNEKRLKNFRFFIKKISPLFKKANALIQ